MKAKWGGGNNNRTILQLSVSFIVGKGGSSSNVVVSPVTITQIGASGIGTNVKLRCDFPSVQNPNSLFWFKANDIIYAEQDNALYISNNVEGMPLGDVQVLRYA